MMQKVSYRLYFCILKVIYVENLNADMQNISDSISTMD